MACQDAETKGPRRLGALERMRQEARQIREAQERGEFDDLPGEGQPLDLAANPYAQDRELAFKPSPSRS